MDNLKDIRKAMGMTQAELAAALGVNQASVSKMEKGKLETNRRTLLAASALLADQRRAPT